ncbi:MAG: hypothetical protein BJG00_011375 [Limnothrix sp. CACIAM 69d]|nr:MAG: hypothetical protein BJG00_011375 [Limnothrix sp. CACIAM 69d]
MITNTSNPSQDPARSRQSMFKPCPNSKTLKPLVIETAGPDLGRTQLVRNRCSILCDANRASTLPWIGLRFIENLLAIESPTQHLSA